MPCDQVISIRGRLEAADRALLERALRALGGHVQATATSLIYSDGRGVYAQFQTDGTVRVSSLSLASAQQQAWLDSVRQAYAGQAIMEAAQQCGWEVEQQDATSYVLQRQ
jgi:hypothetical protein